MPSSRLPRSGRMGRSVLVVAFLVLTSWWAGARPADAHAIVLSTSPGDGAVLDRAPDSVEITFNEPVSADLGGLRVFDASGERVDRGATRNRDDTIGVDLEVDLASGSYLISYRVVSADGHPVRGASIFTVDPSGTAQSPGRDAALFDVLGDDDERGVEIVGAIGRWSAMAGALAVVGAVAFAVATGVAVRDRCLHAAAVLGALGALVAIPVQAALATGQGFGALFQEGVLAGVSRDGFGLAAGLAVVGLAIATLTVDRPARWARPVAIVASLGVVASFALVGHTRFDDVLVGVVADVAHVGAAAVWTGGLAQLFLHRRRLDAAERTRVTARFASLATGAVVVVGLAGLALSWTEVQSLDALWPTTYGRVLLVKLAIVAAIGAIGAHHHFRAVPALAAAPDDPVRQRSMHRSLRLELVGVVAALVATAALVNITPASVDAGIGQIHSEILTLGDAGSVQVVVDPNQTGQNSVHLYFYDPDGRPAEIVEEVGIEFTKSADDIGPIARTLFRAGPSHFQWDGAELVSTGEWDITVVARIDQFTQEQATTSVLVR